VTLASPANDDALAIDFFANICWRQSRSESLIAFAFGRCVEASGEAIDCAGNTCMANENGICRRMRSDDVGFGGEALLRFGQRIWEKTRKFLRLFNENL
jgi:hypothetical protein